MKKMYMPEFVGFSAEKKESIMHFLSSHDVLFNTPSYVVFPGFCDVHVHFREPGFSYKETMLSGSMAAAHGGYTDVLTMPNLNPVPDTLENLMLQKDMADKNAKIKVYPMGSITVGEKGEALSEMEAMAPFVLAFSDDGRGVQSDSLMEEAMKIAKHHDKIISAHCEVNSLLEGGYIHDGEYAKEHNHRGISSESEYKQIERDLVLAEKIGVKYHVCHISTKESVEVIRQAKKRGVDVTCETGPHYLVFDDSNLEEDGKWKMNPPLRSREDKEALIEGICDGTIDMIATDHAPHSAEEKAKGLEKSAFGIVGLETAFSVLYTHLVKKGVITLPKLIELLTKNPKERFGIDEGLDFTVWKLDEEVTVNPDDFLSKGKSTPFTGMALSGKCVATVCGGEFIYREDK